MSKKLIKNRDEKGITIVIALFVMVILMAFAAFALSRATAETKISASDEAEGRTYSAAEAALEDITREFATKVENKLNITPTDITELENRLIPRFSENGYTFTTEIDQIGTSEIVNQNKGKFQGLVSLRDEWQIKITAREDATGVESVIRRRFFNDRIPIFQFGAFYQDDIEVNNPPTFIFNGRIHTNGNFFTNSGGSDIRYKSKITIAGELIRDRWKNGAALTSGERSDNVWALNTANSDKQVPTNSGSVTCTDGTGGVLKEPPGERRNFPYPNCVANSGWTTFSRNFEGNVVTKAKELNLPVSRINKPLIEMVRRSKNIGDMANFSGTVRNVTSSADIDDGVLSKERFANKEGLRISLADSKNKLPQCVNVSPCGVRLDGRIDSGDPNYLGYKPKTMRGTAYKTTPLNGNRLAVNGREVWIKIELVKYNPDTQKPETNDVTEDILSLGVTEPFIKSGSPADLQMKNYDANTDSRSIIKLQRFAIKGAYDITESGTTYKTSYTIGSDKYNSVVRETLCNPAGNSCTTTGANSFAVPMGSTTVSSDESKHYQLASFNGGITNTAAGKTRQKIVPFPIQLQDTREGNRSNATDNLSANEVFKNGVISLVDIDVANLRRFFNGDFDNNFPVDTPFSRGRSDVPLKSSDVPNNRGWVIYFSDRRGDANFDGKYNFEDVYPFGNDVVDEDLDNDGTILSAANSGGEAPTEDSKVGAGYAAVTDHSYYRRGVRLVNGKTLPGNYNYASPELTTGFTLASENGVYVQGDYNVSGVTVAGGTTSTTSDNYQPQGKTPKLAGTSDGNLHIPAAVIGDAVTILSNSWDDTKSFAYPNDLTKRAASDTRVRFAMLAGDPLTGRSPSEGLNGKQNGGLINFKRFLEGWTGDRLNYSGSLINLYNSYNSNGRHKPNNATYNPPFRDWTFEESFKDPNRLPPGTPFVYFITFTGYERINDD